ncbi:MAG: hypothetical protein WD771_07835 [Gemmatimonadaceae bacterium]
MPHEILVLRLLHIVGVFVARPRAMRGKYGAMDAANGMLGLSVIGMAIARYVT